ncbi:class I SAM-dependent methyltransferase [Streptomyces sp. WI04-05B]|uniref:class I SAM-dependent methyltransferase n=1 Tax=Streptomyces TaxID=1883 RepID=UPI0029BE83EB|nr:MULTISPECIES: class I SAM-dependent methyltransferase [unclassified Streptomyces]MDX2541924.1 class I SAM-dependent methyltransferase [Streptomyces sp. WI04-05B]MDX2587006.1 class I SAM-dependent methyltransferase [Streptomyces sp. WI04-05A]MDX3749974.1 class I SAM-dependent methyltransferase [Streptomyces sp. AK08-02]
MTPTLVRQHLPHTGRATRVDLCTRARDWSEIQERMFVPLYETVYERLEVGSGTRMLGLGCGSGLALLMAASRGAAVTGVETSSPQRLGLARERLLPEPGRTRARGDARLVTSLPEEADSPPYTLVTAFEPIGCLAGDSEGLVETLAAAVPSVGRGTPVVLVGWGPPERCATSAVLRVAARLADPLRVAGSWRPSLRDDLEEVAQRAGLRPDGSGRVACPFGYANLGSAVRGLLSTGLFDAAITATGQEQVDKELAEALHPHQRRDGTIWMPNVFRYLIALTA